MSGPRSAARTLAAASSLLAMLALGAPGAPPARAETIPRTSAPGGSGEAGKPGATSTFRVVDIEAIKGLLRQGRGHVLLVHFWASWCAPCLEELPVIDKFAHDMKPRGLEVVSLSLDNPARMGPRVGALLRKSAPNLTPNIARFDDADELIAAIDPRWAGAIPALFLYDHQGQLRGNLIGEASRAELEQFVGAWLKAAADSASPHAPGAVPGNKHGGGN